jgi:hypothetical protein
MLLPLHHVESRAYAVLLLCCCVQLWVLFGGVDMVAAALKRDPAGRSPSKVFYDMFKCWRDAFEDFIPGVKAEWKQVFHNRVSVATTAAGDLQQQMFTAEGVPQQQVATAG